MRVEYYANPPWNDNKGLARMRGKRRGRGASSLSSRADTRVVYLVYNDIFVGGFSYKSFMNKIWYDDDQKRSFEQKISPNNSSWVDRNAN